MMLKAPEKVLSRLVHAYNYKKHQHPSTNLSAYLTYRKQKTSFIGDENRDRQKATRGCSSSD